MDKRRISRLMGKLEVLYWYQNVQQTPIYNSLQSWQAGRFHAVGKDRSCDRKAKKNPHFGCLHKYVSLIAPHGDKIGEQI